jgi:subtilisin-like proprotein convertase family protein
MAALIGAAGMTGGARLGARGGQDVNGISPQALAQIDALLQEKAARTPAERKIDSQLLYAMRMAQGQPVAPGVQTLAVDIPRATDGHAIVDVKAAPGARLATRLQALTDSVVAFGADTVQLHLDLAELEALAADPDVRWIQPQRPPATARLTGTPGVRSGRGPLIFTGAGSITSQGDITHRAALFRALTSATGAGIKIGVIADGAFSLPNVQASGDLGPVTVLGDPGGDDEGTAMLEIIHDLAPGAQLFFTVAPNTIAGFADSVHALRDAGCDIIVDDVQYDVESPFQDGQGAGVNSNTDGGLATQAVKDVTAAGALFFSAAGNGGGLDRGSSSVWEGDFSDGGVVAAPLPAGTRLHLFAPGQAFNTLSGRANRITLFWSDPMGQSANDYDLFDLNAAGTAVLGASTNPQTGTQDPFEETFAGVGDRVVVVKSAGAANRFLHLNANGSPLQIATAGQTHGHAATSNPFSFGVAATDASAVYPGPFTPAGHVEPFSSDGPRRIFFSGDGVALTPGNLSSTGGTVLQKPDLTAADDVSVSGAGGLTTFVGTSAAAPHAAAIAALIKSANPGFTQAQIRAALLSSAIDIEAAGVDRDSGAGVVMAQPAQPACSFSLAGSANFGANAGTRVVTITASAPSCNWVIWSNVNWITIETPAGTGSGQATLVLAPNGGAGRTGTVTVEGGSSISIIQNNNPAAPSTFTFTGPATVADNTTTNIALPVAGVNQPIGDVTLSLFLKHTFDSDLVISLISPDGTTVPLSVRHGNGEDNYGSACSPVGSRTTFSDSATASIEQGFAPFVGTFLPEQPLAAFRGKVGSAVNGTWTLRVADVAAEDSGELECASLNISTRTPKSVLADFDGDASADIALYRTNGDWAIRKSSTSFATSFVGNLGGPGYTMAPGDFDSDGIQDLAVYRESTGDWFVLTSSSGYTTSQRMNWGGPGLKPEPGDYDGDGRTDFAVYDPQHGIWSILKSTTGYTAASTISWGGAGFTAVPGQDFDGDGVSDIAVYRASTGVWSILTSSSNFTSAINVAWGGPGFVLVPGDYDGDHKADLGLYDPSTGRWSILLSGAAYTTTRSINFGGIGFAPVSADFDGDGRIDAGLFQSSTGKWFVLKSTTNYDTAVTINGWGGPGDRPVSSAMAIIDTETTRGSDFNGDARADLTTFNSATGVWTILTSSSAYAASITTGLGGSTYVPLSGDFDGDGKADVAVYHPVTGDWFVLLSSTGFTTSLAKSAGGSGWAPVPADYDGDGRTDFAVYNTTTGVWFVLKSSTNYTTTVNLAWGGTGFTAAPADFDGDGRADLAIYRQATGDWSVLLSSTNYTATIAKNAGGPGYVPVPGDFDGDARADFAVYNTTTGGWFVLKSSTNFTTALSLGWGGTGYTPIEGDFDGDGKADLAVYQDATGAWFILLSSTGYTTSLTRSAGGAGLTPVPRYL